MMLFSLLQRLGRCTSGTATLEAAIALPVAISLMAGGVEFGLIFSAYGTAEKSTRDAARYLARVPQQYVCDWGLTDATNLAIYGKLNPTPGVDQLRLPITTTITAQGCPGSITFTVIRVDATVPYNGIGSLFAAIGLPASRTINVKHEERYIGE
jgi:TadE-like protein